MTAIQVEASLATALVLAVFLGLSTYIYTSAGSDFTDTGVGCIDDCLEPASDDPMRDMGWGCDPDCLDGVDDYWLI